jgi:hypothetical protein
MDSVNKRCAKCSCGFEINYSGGWVTTNITADRIRNDEDHNLDNIQPMCSYCNCCKSDK